MISRIKRNIVFRNEGGGGGGSEAVWKFLENSSNLVQVVFPNCGWDANGHEDGDDDAYGDDGGHNDNSDDDDDDDDNDGKKREM